MRVLSLLMIATLLLACGRYFPPNRDLKRHVDKSEVVGIWSIGADTLEVFDRDGYILNPLCKHTLVFRKDGSMTFDSAYPEIDEITHITAEGSWALTHNSDDTSSLELNLRLNEVEHSEIFSFTEEDGRLVLWQGYGDPDMWEFIEYTKH